MSKSSQVVNNIVDHGICCGCGICAGVCPFHNLKMTWCDNGDIAPRLLGECPSNCHLCLKVCPFGPQAKSEDRLAQIRFGYSVDIAHDALVGFYLESFVGYSLVSDHRVNGASGGMTTWLIETLLVSGVIDAVVCVSEGESSEVLFEYKKIVEVERLRGAAGSRYYPVNIAKAVSMINDENQEVRYAVVGLPCVLKGLHLAMEAMPRLRRRIVYTLGLTCGHMPNRFYTEYLASLSGVSSKLLATAQYRLKKDTTRAGNFMFRAVARSGCSGATIPFSRISNIWSDCYFQVNACNYCDDVFAEIADITFMDAWLPQYSRDPRGHSMVVVRHQNLLPILDEGVRSGTCHLESIPISKIVESQRGVVEKKRLLLGARLFAATLKGQHIPIKRISPDKNAYKQHRKKVEMQLAIQQASKNLWFKYGSRYLVFFKFCLLCLSLPLMLQRMSTRVLRLLSNPSLLLRSIRGA